MTANEKGILRYQELRLQTAIDIVWDAYLAQDWWDCVPIRWDREARRLWDRCGLTLEQRDRAIIRLAADGKVRIEEDPELGLIARRVGPSLPPDVWLCSPKENEDEEEG